MSRLFTVAIIAIIATHIPLSAATVPELKNFIAPLQKTFSDMVHTWGPYIEGVAENLLYSLSAIQISLIGMKLIFKENVELPSILGELVRFIMIAGFMLFLIRNHGDFLQQILDSFIKIADKIAGKDLLRDLMQAISVMQDKLMKEGISWSSFKNSLVIILMGLIAVFVMVVAIITALKNYVFALFAIQLAPILFAVSVLEYTRSWALSAITLVIKYSVKFMVLMLVISLSMGVIIASLKLKYTDGGALTMLTISILTLDLVKEGEGMVEGLFSGSHHSSGSAAGKVVGNLAKKVAQLAATVATGGGAAVAAGAAGVASGGAGGFMKSLKAAFSAKPLSDGKSMGGKVANAAHNAITAAPRLALGTAVGAGTSGATAMTRSLGRSGGKALNSMVGKGSKIGAIASTVKQGSSAIKNNMAQDAKLGASSASIASKALDVALNPADHNLAGAVAEKASGSIQKASGMVQEGIKSAQDALKPMSQIRSETMGRFEKEHTAALRKAYDNHDYDKYKKMGGDFNEKFLAKIGVKNPSSSGLNDLKKAQNLRINEIRNRILSDGKKAAGSSVAKPTKKVDSKNPNSIDLSDLDKAQKVRMGNFTNKNSNKGQK